MSTTPAEVSERLSRAAKLVQAGEGPAARRLLRQILPPDPAPALSHGLSRDLYRGVELWRGNRLRLADQTLADYNRLQPNDALALQLRAHIAIQMGALDEAIKLLQQCLALHPAFLNLRMELSHLLARRQRFAEALQQTELLLHAQPDSIEFLLLKAAQLDRSGQYPAAIAILESVIALLAEAGDQKNSELASAWTTLGMLQRTVGDQAAAIHALQQAIALDPNRGWPWFQLSDLKTWPFGAEQTKQINQGLLRALPGSMNEVHFAFALGRSLESQGQFDEAFAAYQRANQVRASLAPFNMAAFRRELAATQALFTSGTTSRESAQNHCPVIFVLGLPRSGTTLVDQIITAHSTVDGTMELPIISTLIRELQQRQLKAGQTPWPAPGTQLSDPEAQQMGQEYLHRAQIQRGTAAFFVDKMPFNFQHIGLIRKILPGARIVHVQRDPMAMGFSIYRQLFRFGQDWAFDLGQIGEYYQAYAALMNHWDEIEPGQLIPVQYEALVQAPEIQIRKLLQRLELSEEAACFKPQENRRPVRTASSEQVRLGIHTSAIDYWRNFAHHLDPLRLALGPHANLQIPGSLGT